MNVRLTSPTEIAILLLTLTAPISSPPVAAGQALDASQVEAGVKAGFLYNFTRYIEWPKDRSTGAFTIGVLGKGDLAAALELIIRGKTVNGRPIVLRHLNTAGEAEPCEILLIERTEIKHVKQVVMALSGKPLLTVCDGDACAKGGGVIAFVVVNETVRFRINQEAAGRAGLQISSQLMKLAVDETGRTL